MPDRIAIVPARGGSKRIPHKNKKRFLGRPLIEWPLSKLVDCGLFQRVVVSTDDPELAHIAASVGAEVPFMRPGALADDFTPTLPVVAHALDELGVHNDTFVACVYPGAVLIELRDLVGALDLLCSQEQAEFSAVVGLFEHPVQRALRMDSQSCLEPLYPEFVASRTQDLEPTYHDLGQFYWGRARAWRTQTGPLESAVGYLVPKWKALDIDTPDDWDRAELLARAVGLAASEDNQTG